MTTTDQASWQVRKESRLRQHWRVSRPCFLAIDLERNGEPVFGRSFLQNTGDAGAFDRPPDFSPVNDLKLPAENGTHLHSPSPTAPQLILERTQCPGDDSVLHGQGEDKRRRVPGET